MWQSNKQNEMSWKRRRRIRNWCVLWGLVVLKCKRIVLRMVWINSVEFKWPINGENKTHCWRISDFLRWCARVCAALFTLNGQFLRFACGLCECGLMDTTVTSRIKISKWLIKMPHSEVRWLLLRCQHFSTVTWDVWDTFLHPCLNISVKANLLCYAANNILFTQNLHRFCITYHTVLHRLTHFWSGFWT